MVLFRLECSAIYILKDKRFLVLNPKGQYMKTWEDQVSLFPGSDEVRPKVGIASDYLSEKLLPRFASMDYENKLPLDEYPLPSKVAREGYYGEHHLNYWMSGLRDSSDTLKIYSDEVGGVPESYMDFGGASGRVARHMALQHDIPEVWVADINREHINFLNDVFDGRIKAFQCLSIPHLPFEDNSLDFITAFSVFSHIETFDETWLLELRRVLKPGGLLVVTANVDTFQDITENWPVYKPLANHPDFDTGQFGKPLTKQRMVVRWNNDGSYSSVVFMRSDYVKKRWEPMFAEMTIIPYLTQFQTGVVFRK